MPFYTKPSRSRHRAVRRNLNKMHTLARGGCSVDETYLDSSRVRAASRENTRERKRDERTGETEEKRDRLDFATRTRAEPDLHGTPPRERKRRAAPRVGVSRPTLSATNVSDTTVEMLMNAGTRNFSAVRFLFSERERERLTFPASSFDAPCPFSSASASTRGRIHPSSGTSLSEPTMSFRGSASRPRSSAPDPQTRPETLN